MYLLDSNIYINFYDRYYKMDYFPSFWQKLPHILTKVVIPDIVVDENYQNKIFKTWLDNNYKSPLLSHKKFASQWANIIQHIANCGYYKDTALTSDKGWAKESIADPWIIAIAKEENHTIVTDEIKNPNLNKLNPSKSAKIPDVCDQLGVRCITMNQFFEEIKLRV